MIQKDLPAPQGSLITPGWRRTVLERPPLSLAPCLFLTGPRCLVWGVDSKTVLESQHLPKHTVRAGGRGAFACLSVFCFFFLQLTDVSQSQPMEPPARAKLPGAWHKEGASVSNPSPPPSSAHPGRNDGVSPRPVEQVRSYGESPALELMGRTGSRITSEANQWDCRQECQALNSEMNVRRAGFTCSENTVKKCMI